MSMKFNNNILVQLKTRSNRRGGIEKPHFVLTEMEWYLNVKGRPFCLYNLLSV